MSTPWTADAADRLWEDKHRNPDSQEPWFSFQVQRALVNYLRMTGRLEPGVELLDFGCGRGFLIEALLNAGAHCRGVDRSAAAVEQVNRSFHDRPGWGGAVLVTADAVPFADLSFDLVTCVETLEHLDDFTLDHVLGEIHRLLRPGGAAFFTTPNDEELASSSVYCPFCERRFHPMQHLRSFTAASLIEVLEQRGFSVAVCVPTNLEWFQMRYPRSPLEWSIRVVGSWLRRSAYRLLDRLIPRPFPAGREFRHWTGSGPHLTAVAVRDSGQPGGGAHRQRNAR